VTPLRIFVSSVQREFAAERAELHDYLRGDPLLRRFFEAFLFETVPASDRRADDLYLDQARRCDIYIGLFGYEYGSENASGQSPTEREFEAAGTAGRTRLIFVKGTDDARRHPKMRALVSRAGGELIRRRFTGVFDLIAAVYAALVRILEERELIRVTPFDATFCRDATLADLDVEWMRRFAALARRSRGFPLAEGASSEELLMHLNLLDRGRPTNAAVLLFGRQPQRFLIASEVKCAHFHGTEVAKPIPSYQVYKGTIFELVDQAVDFVMSKINLAVGTRALSTQVPVAYEMPIEVVREAIVNAVAHRDYTSNGSVQVMLFANRLEVWNPGHLPPSLTLEMLRRPHGSVPGNPLLAESLYLAKYIERMGTGTEDMISRCRAAGLPEPQFSVRDGFVCTLERRPESAFSAVTPDVAPPVTPPVAPPVTPPVTPPVAALLRLLAAGGELSNAEIRDRMGLADRTHVREHYIDPALSQGLIEQTIPEKPQSRLQKYRLTERGKDVVRRIEPRTEDI